MAELEQGVVMQTINITDSDIYKDIRAYIKGLFNIEAVQGYSNNVPMPNGSFVVMRILFNRAISTNWHEYDIEQDQAQVTQSREVTMQLDFYNAPNQAQTFVQLWRDYHACDGLNVVQPLYANDARFMPITNEEKNYESRYIVEAVMQYNPVVTHEQVFIDEMPVTVNLLN